MKFPKFNTAERGVLHIPAVTKGIDLSEADHKNDPQALAEGKNVWEENGILKTRPAISTDTERLIADSNYLNGYYYDYRVGDVEINAEGDLKRLVLEQIDLDSSNIVCLTHFISSDGSIYKTAEIFFSRVDDETFYIPDKINFFKGAGEQGSGIFALCFAVNCENYTQTDCRIYELSSDLTQWQRVYTPYIPTALINGRGNKYEIARSTNQAFTGTPERLEPLNVLDSTFHAYYSTDGCSSAFRLPFAGISEKRVVCRLYYSVENYVEWIIEENQVSASTELYGVEVTMQINREKGIVSFSVEAGEYELPLITERNENNLRITATKQCDESIKAVADAGVVASVDNYILVGNKNRVYEANYRNPLYFPVDSTATLGSADSAVKAFAKLGSKIIAFKENEIYSVKADCGQKLSGTSLLAETDRVFWDIDRLSFECLSPNLGCNDKNSVITLNRRIFWFAAGRVYSLESSGKITALSLPLEIGEYSNVAGLSFKNYCIFFSDFKAFVMKFDAENKTEPCWYYWEFPQKIKLIGGYMHNGRPTLLCRNTLYKLCFTACLEGERDGFLAGRVTSAVVSFEDIPCLIRTKRLSLGCDNSFKKLDSIILQLKGNADITVNDRLQARITGNSETRLIKLTPGLCAVNTADIEIKADSPVSVGSIDIGYTSLKL